MTGAGGFTGAALVRKLISLRGQADYFGNVTSLVLVDHQLAAMPDAAFVRFIEGDITDQRVQEEAIGSGVDCLFHLAAVPGGAAEANEPLGRAVNFDASRGLVDTLSRQGNRPRVVFSSSIGVFGTPMPEAIGDDTYPVPAMSYGAQKLMVEILLADASRRGRIDARSVRLPGIVARPRQKTGHISAYMSEIFHALMAGEAFVCPVSAGAQSWLMSLRCCVENLLHAAQFRRRLSTAAAPGLCPPFVCRWQSWRMPSARLPAGKFRTLSATSPLKRSRRSSAAIRRFRRRAPMPWASATMAAPETSFATRSNMPWRNRTT